MQDSLQRPSPRTGAVLHPSLTPPIERVGGLPWWIFRNCDSEPQQLIPAALEAGFPAAFLPLPFPVAPAVALRRGLDRATANAPGERREWRYDLVLRPGAKGTDFNRVLRDLLTHHDVTKEVESWIRDFSPHVAVAMVLRWEPSAKRPRRPWNIRVWCVQRCDPAASLMPLDKVLFIGEVEPDVGITGVMAGRIRNKVEWVRTRFTAPEIAAGVTAAFEDVGGVKLRPGLFSVPGPPGVARGEQSLDYLRAVGDTEAGMYDLYDEAAQVGAKPGLVFAVLQGELAELHDEISALDVETVGVGALRTRWYTIADLEEKLLLNRGLLGTKYDALKAELGEMRRTLLHKKQEREQHSEDAVELAPSPDQKALGHLWEGLLGLDAAVATGVRLDVGVLTSSEEELLAGQRTVRDLRLRHLIIRLRKLVAATVYAFGIGFEDSVRAMFVAALKDAVAYVRAGLRQRGLVPDTDSRPS